MLTTTMKTSKRNKIVKTDIEEISEPIDNDLMSSKTTSCKFFKIDAKQVRQVLNTIESQHQGNIFNIGSDRTS